MAELQIKQRLRRESRSFSKQLEVRASGALGVCRVVGFRGLASPKSAFRCTSGFAV